MSTSTKQGAHRASLLGRSDGFTLIEALVATSLLGIISLGFAIGADRAVRYNVYGRSLTAAITLAHDKVEELQSKVTTDTQLTTGTHSDANSPMKADGTINGPYARTWTVTNNTPTNGLKTVAVEVAWALYGESHTVRLVMVHS